MNAGVTFEHLFNGTHGLIVEGNVNLSSNRRRRRRRKCGGAVGYRWHWRGRQNSGFLGVMIAHGMGAGTVTESDGMAAAMKYPDDLASTSISTANIGKRWMVSDAVEALRFGAT